MGINIFNADKKVYSDTIKVAAPSIAEFFLVSLITSIDSIMVSSLGHQALAAVSLVNQPANLARLIVVALNVGVTAIVARRKGEDDQNGANICLKQSILLSTVISITISLLLSVFAQQVMLFAGADADTIVLSTIYFQTILIGMPLNCITLTICAALRGIGRTKDTLKVNVLSNIINIIINYFLIGGKMGFPALGVYGAAIATNIGWFSGLLIAFVCVSRKGAFLYLFSRSGWLPQLKLFIRLYKISANAFWEQFCVRSGMLITNKIFAQLGPLLYATHAICNNILNLSFCIGEGLSVSAVSLTGQSLGAKRPDLACIYGSVAQKISLISCTVLMLTFLTAGKQLIMLYSTEPEILQVGAKILIVAAIITYGQSGQKIYLGSLRGAGDTKYTAIISLICIMIIRPFLSYLFIVIFKLGLIGGWVALLLEQYLRLILTFTRYKSKKWALIEV